MGIYEQMQRAKEKQPTRKAVPKSTIRKVAEDIGLIKKAKVNRTERNQTQITLRIETDVLKFFKKDGPGYQTRINAALRKFMEENS